MMEARPPSRGKPDGRPDSRGGNGQRPPVCRVSSPRSGGPGLYLEPLGATPWANSPADGKERHIVDNDKDIQKEESVRMSVIKSDIIQLSSKVDELCREVDARNKRTSDSKSHRPRSSSGRHRTKIDENVLAKFQVSADPEELYRSKYGLMEVLLSLHEDAERASLDLSEKHCTPAPSTGKEKKKGMSRITGFLALLNRVNELHAIVDGTALTPPKHDRHAGEAPEPADRGMSGHIQKCLQSLVALRRKHNLILGQTRSLMQATVHDLGPLLEESGAETGKTGGGAPRADKEVRNVVEALGALAAAAEEQNLPDSVGLRVAVSMLTKDATEATEGLADMEALWLQAQTGVAALQSKVTELTTQGRIMQRRLSAAEESAKSASAAAGSTSEASDEMARMEHLLQQAEARRISDVGLHQEKLVCLEAAIDSLRSKFRTVSDALKESEEQRETLEEQLEAARASAAATPAATGPVIVSSNSSDAEKELRLQLARAQAELEKVQEEAEVCRRRAVEAEARVGRREEALGEATTEVTRLTAEVTQLREDATAHEDALERERARGEDACRARDDVELELASIRAEIGSSRRLAAGPDTFEAVLADELSMMREAYEAKLKTVRAQLDTEISSSRKSITELKEGYEAEVKALRRRLDFFQSRPQTAGPFRPTA